MPDEQPKRPPSLDEFRKATQAEHQLTAKQLAEEWIDHLRAREPRRFRERPKSPPRPEHFLPGFEPRKRGES
jgi:hypothetical protein